MNRVFTGAHHEITQMNDAQYIIGKNTRIAEQSFKHTFFPLRFYNVLLEERTLVKDVDSPKDTRIILSEV